MMAISCKRTDCIHNRGYCKRAEVGVEVDEDGKCLNYEEDKSGEKRLIDANALENVLEKRSDELFDEHQIIISGAVIGAIGFVHRAPTVDAVEVIHAYYGGNNRCSECGAPGMRFVHGEPKPCDLFCWNCGARMDGKAGTK